MPQRRPMSRKFRWLLTGVILLGAAAIIGWFGVAPLYVRSVITQALHDAGVDASSFELSSLGPTQAFVHQVRLGSPQWLSVESIDLTYSPLSLWRGRVKAISLDGVEWHIRVRDGNVDFGPRFGSSSSAATDDLPFDLLDIRNATLRIEQGGQTNSINASASVRRTGIGRFDAQANFAAERIQFNGASAVSPQIGVQLVVASLGANRALEGTIDLTTASLEVSAQELKLQNVATTVPFAMGSSPGRSGRIQTGPITWRGMEMPGIVGNVEMTETRLRTQFTWPVTADATLQVDGWLEFGNGPLNGKVTAITPPFDLTDTALLTAFAPKLEGIEVGGRYSVDAVVTLEQGRIDSRITLAGERMTLNGPDWPGRVDDADVQLTITGLQPLATEPNQVLFVNKAKIGEIDVTDASFAFTLESPERLNVHHASWHMAGTSRLGRFELDPFVVDPSNAQFRSTLHCEEVGLGPWLELLTSDRVTSDGQLEGLISFAFDSRRTRAVELGNGVLEARPSRGNIRIKDKAMAEQLLEQIDVGDQKFVVQVRDRIMTALQDFEYSSLSVEFTSEGEDYVCQLQASGKGRTGPDPQEFAAIVVNVHNFNTLLRDALAGRDIYQRLRE